MRKATALDLSKTVFAIPYNMGAGVVWSLCCTLENGNVAIVSPPKTLKPSLTEAGVPGTLKAIIAPNKFHSLGLAPWASAHPGVPVVAAADACARLSKVSQQSVAPLESLAASLPAHVRVFCVPHMKNGEIVVMVKTAEGWLWYITDLFLNARRPSGMVANLMLWVVGGPGLRANRLCRRLFVKNGAALRDWFLSQWQTMPPVKIVFAHGDALSGPDIARFRQVIANVR